MSKFVGVIIGAAEITVGVILEFVPGMQGLGTFLIIAGAGQLIGGVGTLLSQPQGGLAVATRNPVAPWNVIYGKTKIGGTIIYFNESGDNDKYLDIVSVLACHPCDAVEAVLFDNQRLQIDPATGCSFSPVQQTVSISSITRSNGVVTVVLPADIPLLEDGDQLQIKNVTTDKTLNGIYTVTVVSQTHGSPGTITFSYICGGANVAITSQGQAKTRWADYRAKVYFEALLGTHTTTFAGMLNGTPYDGNTGNLIQPNPNPWTSAHLCSGRTVVFLRLHYNDEVFSGGLPNISFRVRGKNDIYDPRTGTNGYTENAAPCIADYLHSKWGFSAIYSTEIPDDGLIAAANTCDEVVTLASGSTQARYTCDGTFQLSTSRGGVLQNLLTSCGGRITFVGGQFRIWPAAWSLASNLSIGCGRNLTSATLSAWSDYTGNSSPNGQAEQLIQYSVDGGANWAEMFHSFTDYSLRLDTVSLPGLAYVGDLQVRAVLSNTLLQDPINTVARYYDVFVDVVFADSTTARIRPSANATTLYAGTNSLAQQNGEIDGPELAYDVDASPPLTYATIITRRTAPLAASANTITWSGFADPNPDTDIAPALSGPLEWHPRVPIRELYNSVKGIYISPTNSWQTSDFPPYQQDALHASIIAIAISAASGNGSVLTYTYTLTSGPALRIGMGIAVSGCTTAGFNGTKTISALGSGTFSAPGTVNIAETEAGASATTSPDPYLLADGGDRRYKEIQLPFTIDSSRAQRLAKIELMRHREQGVGTFRFNMHAYKYTALDVLKFTFPFFGWTNKLLEVAAHRLTLNKQDDNSTLLGVEMEMQETDPSVYDWSSAEELTPQGFQQGGVPGIVPGATMDAVAPPTAVTAVSSTATSITGTDGITVNRILVSWTAPADAFVTAIQAQYQLSGATTWTDLPQTPVPSTQFYIPGVVSGQAYLVQIRSVASTGFSGWVQAGPVTVAGTPTALPPANISTTGATTGQVLVYNGTSYVPTTISAGATWTTETPAGTLDGTNRVFTLSFTPIVLFLFLNGVLQVQGVNYTLSGTTITFASAPHPAPKTRDSGYMTAIYPH